MKKTLALLVSFVMFAVLGVKGADPVTWSYKLIDENTDHPAVQMTATVAAGYHLYDFTHGGMENPLNISVKADGATLVGKPAANKKFTAETDEDGMPARYYTGSVTFTQKLKATKPEFKLTIKITGQACDDNSCSNINVAKIMSGKASVAGDVKEEETETPETPAEELADTLAAVGAVPAAATDSVSGAVLNESEGALWANVEAEVKALGTEEKEASLWAIFLAGVIGGLIALITPCVWPMIPMTVSFFLKQNKSRAKSVRSASVYGLSIIVIYVLIGLVVTAIFGEQALNALSTNAVFNVFFFLLLVVFAISFMGGFELTLPSKWTNKMDSKVDSTTGMLSIFFMAFTLALVSFSCTGPIIGTLLVEAATSGNYLAPAIGMFGFALALALPFTIFAMFPTMLKSMPKSGGWLNSVKVVLGFLPHDSKVEKTGVGRFMLALVSFAFAVYMIPGLWGAPLKAISAFAPPSNTQDFSLFEGEVKARSHNYEEGVALGLNENKPILLDFSGHGCTNCRELEGAVWTNDEVRNIINDKFILVSLMVDERTKLPEQIIKTNRKGETVILETVGELWGFLESEKFGIMAQPYHIIIDHNGKPLSQAMDYNNGKNVDNYIKFLETGLNNFAKQTAPASSQEK